MENKCFWNEKNSPQLKTKPLKFSAKHYQLKKQITMKHLKFVITKVCVLLLFLSNTAVATSVSSFEMLPTPDEKEFLLTAVTSGEGTISIKILDHDEKVIFSKSMKALTSFEQKYSLKDFEKGHYSLVIEDESKIMTQPFTIATAIEVNSDLKTFIYKPFLKFNYKIESLAVNWMKSDNSDCQFIIKDEKSNVLFKESVENDRLIHRSYDFSQLPNGTYFITIKDGQHTYQEIIELR